MASVWIVVTQETTRSLQTLDDSGHEAETKSQLIQDKPGMHWSTSNEMATRVESVNSKELGVVSQNIISGTKEHQTEQNSNDNITNFTEEVKSNGIDSKVGENLENNENSVLEFKTKDTEINIVVNKEYAEVETDIIADENVGSLRVVSSTVNAEAKKDSCSESVNQPEADVGHSEEVIENSYKITENSNISDKQDENFDMECEEVSDDSAFRQFGVEPDDCFLRITNVVGNVDMPDADFTNIKNKDNNATEIRQGDMELSQNSAAQLCIDSQILKVYPKIADDPARRAVKVNNFTVNRFSEAFASSPSPAPVMMCSNIYNRY